MRIGPAFLMALIITATPHAQTSNATSTGVISGRVVDIDSGEPLPGMRVTVAAASAGRTMTSGLSSNIVTSDSNGRFTVSGVRPGPLVIATQTNEVTVLNRPSPPTHILLEPNQEVHDVVVRSVRSAWIRGRVTDDSGQPVVGMSMVAFMRPTGSSAAFSALRSSVTDDLGDYTIDPLMPGDYVVCACQWMAPARDRGLVHTLGLLGAAPRSSDVPVDVDADWRPPVRTFFPSVTQPGQATILTLRSNEGRTDVHIGLSSARRATISGRLFGLSDAMAASAIRLHPVAQPGEPILPAFEPDTVAADGSFLFRDVPPGNYAVRVRYRGPDLPTRLAGGLLRRLGAIPDAQRAMLAAQSDIALWSETPVTIDGRDVSGLQIGVSPPMQLLGRVRFSDQGRVEPLRANGGRLQRLDEPSDGPPVSSSVRATDDGVFELEGVIPGRYKFDWTILPPGLALESIRFGGRDVTDLPFVIGDGEKGDFEVTLVNNNAGSVRGQIVSIPPAAPPMLVVVFPADRRFWDEPAIATRRFLQTYPDQHGTFRFDEVPPGDYVITSVDALESFRGWMTNPRLGVLAASGRNITVASGDNPPVEIRK